MQDCSILLVEDNLGDARLVQETLRDVGTKTFSVHTVGSLVAALEAASQRNFDLALVDLSLPDSQGLDTLQAIQIHAPGLPIVVLTGLDSETVALAAVERGAQDYLVKGKLSPDSLVRALQYAVVRRHTTGSQPTVTPATVVGVLGAKGGVGVTTMACLYAVELHRQSEKAVLLADLDESGASASFLLKGESQYTVADASSNLHRLDAALWQGVVCKTLQGIDLLRSPGAARFTDQLNAERVRHVMRFARTQYAYLVVDLGRCNAFSLNLVKDVSELLMVTTPDLPALYETGRVLRKLFEVGMAREQTHLLVNRSSRGASCSVGDLERALGYPVAMGFPDSTDDFQEAYAGGNLLGAKLAVQRPIAQLVAKLLGTQGSSVAPPKRRRFFAFART